jgi:hypothetical protein
MVRPHGRERNLSSSGRQDDIVAGSGESKVEGGSVKQETFATFVQLHAGAFATKTNKTPGPISSQADRAFFTA